MCQQEQKEKKNMEKLFPIETKSAWQIDLNVTENCPFVHRFQAMLLSFFEEKQQQQQHEAHISKFSNWTVDGLQRYSCSTSNMLI